MTLDEKALRRIQKERIIEIIKGLIGEAEQQLPEEWEKVRTLSKRYYQAVFYHNLYDQEIVLEECLELIAELVAKGKLDGESTVADINHLEFRMP